MLSHSLRAKVQNTATPVHTDPNFKQVSLLLHGDGTNGAQNNTFLDSSNNNFTITRNGNTTQGTNTPFSQAAGYWSNYFNGANCLSIANNTSLNFTGDFTIECWFYSNASVASGRPILVQKDWTPGVTYPQYGVSFDSSGKLQAIIGNASSTEQAIVGTTTVNANTWYHAAFTLSGSTLYLFLNGNLEATATKTVTLNSTTTPLIIGSGNLVGTNRPFSGYISNCRIVKGTAVYTSAFTPSTIPLTAITNTSLLTCQSNYFKDNSSNNFTLTATGTPSVQPFSPFAPTTAYSTSVNGGSMYFDGTGDYLTVPDNAAYTFGTGAFTVECWVYPLSWNSNGAITGGALNGFQLGQYGNFGTLGVALAGNVWIVTNATLPPVNTWTHIAVTRYLDFLYIYINGVLSTSISNSSNFSSILYVGAATTSSAFFNGYISNLRVVKGTAVYTANFTPPTSPLTAITNTSLLLSGTNAGIIDNAIKNDLETVGNAQVSTAVTKFGTGSMSFDGTGDWLTAPDTPNLQLGTGNFTIEGWVYLNAVGASRGFASKGTSTTGWSIGTNSSNQVVFSHASSTITSTGTLSVSTWYFVTVVREGTGTNQTKIYINGTNDGTGTVSTDFNQTSIMYVGADRVGSNALNGYIDDLRVTKGVARYTANFTPPTQAFPNQ